MLHHLVSIVFCYAFVSLVEYIAHRYFMHRPIIARLFGNVPYLERTYHDHAVLHHGKYYRCFNHEEDPVGKFHNLLLGITTTIAMLVLFCLPAYLIDPITGMYMAAMAIAHNVLWNIIHSEMHLARKPWFARTRIYEYLCFHHFMHHQHANTNYNVLFLLWDSILGTQSRPSEIDELVWTKIQAGEQVDRRGRPLGTK